jgi:hypothetical protein
MEDERTSRRQEKTAERRGHKEERETLNEKERLEIRSHVKKEQTKIMTEAIDKLRNYFKGHTVPSQVEGTKHRLIVEVISGELKISVPPSTVEIRPLGSNSALLIFTLKGENFSKLVYRNHYPEDWTFFEDRDTQYFQLKWENSEMFSVSTVSESEAEKLSKKSNLDAQKAEREKERKRVQ